MIRFTKALAVAAVVLTLPTMASALGVSLVSVVNSGGSHNWMSPGDTITFDLVLENATQADLYGLDVVVTGYSAPSVYPDNTTGLILNGGAVTSEILSEVHVPTVGSFDGLANVRTAPEELWFVDNFNPQALRTSLFAGASLSPKSADGSFDMGIGGGLVSDGDVHFQVSFLASPDIAAGIQTITLNFGTDASVGAVAIGADGVHLPFSNDSYTLNMIPEPGTALLMGLGLAGLAAAGGRRRR